MSGAQTELHGNAVLMREEKQYLGRVSLGRDYMLVIEPGRAERHYWHDLWRYRELFRVLAWRDIAVRYKQTVIGAAWALIRPFLTMVVFTVLFGKLANLPSDGTAPYALMVFAGWSFFATAVGEASNSLLTNANLISKVYFPRLITDCSGDGSVRGFSHQLGHPRDPDGLVPIYARLADSLAAGVRRQLRHWRMDHSAKREVSRFPLRRAVHCPVRPLCVRSASVRTSSRSSGASPIRSIRWSGSSTGFAGAFLVERVSSIGSVSGSVSSSLIFFLWLGIRQFRKMEKSFADLI
jgi:lipopolysaccharide transport system permease protein